MIRTLSLFGLLIPLTMVAGCVVEPAGYASSYSPPYGYPAGYEATYPSAIVGGDTVYLVESPHGWGYWDRQRQWRPSSAPHPNWREHARPHAPPHFQPDRHEGFHREGPREFRRAEPARLQWEPNPRMEQRHEQHQEQRQDRRRDDRWDRRNDRN